MDARISDLSTGTTHVLTMKRSSAQRNSRNLHLAGRLMEKPGHPRLQLHALLLQWDHHQDQTQDQLQVDAQEDQCRLERNCALPAHQTFLRPVFKPVLISAKKPNKMMSFSSLKIENI